MDIVFLGTGGAWGVPEVKCNCFICQEMRRKGEKRERTSLMLRNRSALLIDCSPDLRSQLERHPVDHVGGVLITHEHGDHFIGMDELFAYKRNAPRDRYEPIPVYLTSKSWETVAARFGYLEAMEVIEVREVQPLHWFRHGEYRILPFRTEHGNFARGSVGYLIQTTDSGGRKVRILYTSDFMDLVDMPSDLLETDILVIQSFWLNEPETNRPHHMSFQRALQYIDRFHPKGETYLVHIGDADMVPGDPANTHAKKYEPKDPLRPPRGKDPYPIPLNQKQWQDTVDRILQDRGMAHKVTVAHDDLVIHL
jgi:phosphoribosyl 1,2-cyclic phosphate phosphodiesterase